MRYTIPLLLGTTIGCAPPPAPPAPIVVVDTTVEPTLKPLPLEAIASHKVGNKPTPQPAVQKATDIERLTITIRGGVFHGDPQTIDAIDDAFVERLDLLAVCDDGATIEGWFRANTLLAARATIGGRPFTVGFFEGAVKGWFDAEGMGMNGRFRSRPVNGSRITSRYGLRFHPVDKRQTKHLGTDYGATTGTPIYATAAGHVEVIAEDAAAGRHVFLRHGGDKTAPQTRYLHMSNFAADLKRGDVVHSGQLIGYVGTTGKSTGPHLHYELRYGGLPVNAPATIPRGETALGPSERSIHLRNLIKIMEQK